MCVCYGPNFSSLIHPCITITIKGNAAVSCSLGSIISSAIYPFKNNELHLTAWLIESLSFILFWQKLEWPMEIYNSQKNDLYLSMVTSVALLPWSLSSCPPPHDTRVSTLLSRSWMSKENERGMRHELESNNCQKKDLLGISIFGHGHGRSSNKNKDVETN